MNFIRSLLFNILLYFGIIFASLLCFPFLIFPRKYVAGISYYLGWYIVFITRTVLGTEVEILGREKINYNTKFFVASAHQSMFETFVFNYLVRNAFFVVKKELLSIPLFGSCLKKVGCIGIDRNKVSKENINFFSDLKNQINLGFTLIIFPQGTRIPYNEIRPLKKGIFRIYDNLKINCLPVKLNTGKVWPRNSFMKYPGKISIIFQDMVETGLPQDEFISRIEKSFYN